MVSKYNWQIYLPGVDDVRVKVLYKEKGQKELLIIGCGSMPICRDGPKTRSQLQSHLYGDFITRKQMLVSKSTKSSFTGKQML